MQQEIGVNEQLRTFLKTSKGKSYTIVVVTGLLVLVLAFFAVIPAISSILLQLRQNQDRLQALELIDEKRAALDTLIKRQQASEDIAVALDISLPFELDQEVIFEDIVRFVGQSQSDFRSIRFTDRGQTSSIKSRVTDPNIVFIQNKVVNIVIDGERESIKEFVRLLEEDRRIYNITTLSLSKVKTTGTGEAAGPYRLNLQAEVFYWDVNTIF